MKNYLIILLLITIACDSGIDPESMKLSIESTKKENENNWELIYELNDKAIKLDDSNYKALNNRGWASFKLGYDSLLTLKGLNTSLDIKPSYKFALRNKIVFYFEKNNFSKVIQLGEPYLSKFKTSHIYSLVGESYNKVGNWTKAKWNLDNAIALDSMDSGAYKERGATNRMLKLYDESLQDLNKAIELEAEYHQAFNLGKI